MEQSQFKRWYSPLHLASGGNKQNARAFQNSQHLMHQIPVPKLETRASLDGRSSAGALGRTPLWAMPLSLMPFHGPLLGCCYCPYAAFPDSAHDEGKGRPRVALNCVYLKPTLHIQQKWLHKILCLRKVISRSTGTQLVPIIIVFMFIRILYYVLNWSYPQVLWKLAVVKKILSSIMCAFIWKTDLGTMLQSTL